MRICTSVGWARFMVLLPDRSRDLGWVAAKGGPELGVVGKHSDHAIAGGGVDIAPNLRGSGFGDHLLPPHLRESEEELLIGRQVLDGRLWLSLSGLLVGQVGDGHPSVIGDVLGQGLPAIYV